MNSIKALFKRRVVVDATDPVLTPPTAILPRPRVLSSSTLQLVTERGHLYITVAVDDQGQPFEVFGALGKPDAALYGMTELVCRLVSLSLRRGVPLDEVIAQCRGVQEMLPCPNEVDEQTVLISGLGDAIACALARYQVVDDG